MRDDLLEPLQSATGNRLTLKAPCLVRRVWRANYDDYQLQVFSSIYEFPEFPYPQVRRACSQHVALHVA